eukprot:scaffold19097_cov44-Phaeocystis_antarctica.AAC.1
MSSLLALDRAFAACRVERRDVRYAERGVGWEAGGHGPAAAHERHARREGPAVKAGGARACAERTANMPRMSVTLDVSKLSGWLNAAVFCRVERRAYDAERGVGREAGGRGPAVARERHTRGEGPAVKAEGARACAERTLNMPTMYVTSDVSKLSGWLNAAAPCRVERRACDAG